MSLLLEIILLLVGIHFCIMLLAACYRIVDLWYRIGDFLAGIIARIVILAVLDAGIYLVLPENLQLAFIGGQVGYLVFHILIFWLTRCTILLIESRHR